MLLPLITSGDHSAIDIYLKKHDGLFNSLSKTVQATIINRLLKLAGDYLIQHDGLSLPFIDLLVRHFHVLGIENFDCYLVGSFLHRSSFNDVDILIWLPDEHTQYDLDRYHKTTQQKNYHLFSVSTGKIITDQIEFIFTNDRCSALHYQWPSKTWLFGTQQVPITRLVDAREKSSEIILSHFASTVLQGRGTQKKMLGAWFDIAFSLLHHIPDSLLVDERTHILQTLRYYNDFKDSTYARTPLEVCHQCIVLLNQLVSLKYPGYLLPAFLISQLKSILFSQREDEVRHFLKDQLLTVLLRYDAFRNSRQIIFYYFLNGTNAIDVSKHIVYDKTIIINNIDYQILAKSLKTVGETPILMWGTGMVEEKDISQLCIINASDYPPTFHTIYQETEINIQLVLENLTKIFTLLSPKQAKHFDHIIVIISNLDEDRLANYENGFCIHIPKASLTKPERLYGILSEFVVQFFNFDLKMYALHNYLRTQHQALQQRGAGSFFTHQGLTDALGEYYMLSDVMKRSLTPDSVFEDRVLFLDVFMSSMEKMAKQINEDSLSLTSPVYFGLCQHNPSLLRPYFGDLYQTVALILKPPRVSGNPCCSLL